MAGRIGRRGGGEGMGKEWLRVGVGGSEGWGGKGGGVRGQRGKTCKEGVREGEGR